VKRTIYELFSAIVFAVFTMIFVTS